MTNFIAAEIKVKGDLKQVVSKEIVLRYMYKIPKGVKRIPPGLLWTKIAEKYSCLSFSNAVAIKNYLDDGITSKMLYLKTSYPEAMVELYKLLAESRVYNSFYYRWRSRLLWARYSFHNHSIYLRNNVKNIKDFVTFKPPPLVLVFVGRRRLLNHLNDQFAVFLEGAVRPF